jgi:ADP-ribosyltransferase exoenzyme
MSFQNKLDVLAWREDGYVSINEPDLDLPKTLTSEQKNAIRHPKHKHLVDTSKSIKPSLSTNHSQAAEDYQRGSTDINVSLRESELGGAWPNKQNTIRHLDELTNHQKLDHHTVVYRGLSSDFRNLKVGSKIHDKGYTGTSLSSKIAGLFSDGHTDRCTVGRIHLKPGHTGAYLPQSKPHHKKSAIYNREKEWLLPRGGHFHVLSHSKAADGTHIVDMEYHPHEVE